MKTASIKRPRAAAVVVLATCWVSCTWAEDVSLTIDEAVARAISGSHSMQMAQTAIAAKKEDLTSAQREAWPKLGLEVEAYRGHGAPVSFSAVHLQTDPDVPTSGETITGNYGIAKLNLSAPIYRDGVLFYQDAPVAQAAQAAYSKAQFDAEILAVSTSNLVAKSYVTALSAAEVVSLRQTAVDSLQARVHYIENRVAANIESRSDQLLASAALADQVANLNSARRAESMELVQLSLALGLPPSQRVKLAELPPNLPAVPDVEEFVQNNLDGQPALRAQDAVVSGAKAQLAAARSESLPKLSFETNVHQATDMKFADDGEASFSSVGLKLSMPLMDFSNSAQKRARGYELEEAKQALVAARNTLVQTIYSTYFAYRDSIDNLASAQKRLEQLEYQQQSSAARFSQRLVGFDTVLEDEVAVLEQRIALVQDKYAVWLTYADLSQALGTTFNAQMIAKAP